MDVSCVVFGSRMDLPTLIKWKYDTFLGGGFGDFLTCKKDIIIINNIELLIFGGLQK